ncbi:hypothetical protein GCM10028824_12310 [Hymenobacter segetis]|uniref:Uncharacterized protein n=1 Tax=Hymenobacter segetis TaxID=2025509 RepID=A0ABU9M179_9BACT
MTPSTPGANGSPTPKKGKTKDVIPLGELELATVGLRAADAWDASPLLALLWCSKAQFRDAVRAFNASLGTADEANDDLSPAAVRLEELDATINKSLKFVRNFLIEEHDTRKKAKAYYDAFGLTPAGELPTARPARAKGLAKLVKALGDSGYDKGKYGTEFWRTIEKEYAPLATTSSDVRSDSAVDVGTKNTQEVPLRKMLRALRQHIKTNFPDTYAAEWRNFGFLKESY